MDHGSLDHVARAGKTYLPGADLACEDVAPLDSGWIVVKISKPCHVKELEETMSEQEPTQPEKGATEKFWEATRRTIHSATVQANRYKRLVQKKIDLASLHKKIGHSHADLGRMVDDLRESGETDVLGNINVVQLLQGLDGLKQAAALLEEEIETIKAETGEGEEEGKSPPAKPS